MRGFKVKATNSASATGLRIFSLDRELPSVRAETTLRAPAEVLAPFEEADDMFDPLEDAPDAMMGVGSR